MINYKFPRLSSFRLSIQLLIVNIIIIFFGTIFLIIFNYYLIINDKLVENRIKLSKNELEKITSYLEKNSIINIPLYQTNYRCRVIDKDIDSKLYEEENCDQENLFLNTLELSDLEPYRSGVRAQAVSKNGKLIHDFLVEETRRSLHVCNAPSPAATSSLPIGKYKVELVGKKLGR